MLQEFGRASLTIPNAVDCDRFFPGLPTLLQPTTVLTTLKGQVRSCLARPAVIQILYVVSAATTVQQPVDCDRFFSGLPTLLQPTTVLTILKGQVHHCLTQQARSPGDGLQQRAHTAYPDAGSACRCSEQGSAACCLWGNPALLCWLLRKSPGV